MASQDTLIDGDFSRAQPIGARRFEYPFRMNGDRVTALFEEDFWQLKSTWVPHELTTAHHELRDFYLISETQPVEFLAGLFKFTRTYSRIPSQQIEYSSIVVTMPEPSSAGGKEGKLTYLGQSSSTSNDKAYLSEGNYVFALGSFFKPLKYSTAHSSNLTDNTITWTVTNHSFDSTKDVMFLLGGNVQTFSFATPISPGTSTSQWTSVNADAIKITYTAGGNYTNGNYAFCQYNRSTFGSGSRYVRCKRVTDFYLPGVSTGITTPADIPLPADQSNSSAFLDALIAGSGTLNMQVGELKRWRESPIYSITKTTIEAIDLV